MGQSDDSKHLSDSDIRMVIGLALVGLILIGITSHTCVVVWRLQRNEGRTTEALEGSDSITENTSGATTTPDGTMENMIGIQAAQDAPKEKSISLPVAEDATKGK